MRGIHTVNTTMVALGVLIIQRVTVIHQNGAEIPGRSPQMTPTLYLNLAAKK